MDDDLLWALGFCAPSPEEVPKSSDPLTSIDPATLRGANGAVGVTRRYLAKFKVDAEHAPIHFFRLFARMDDGEPVPVLHDKPLKRGAPKYARCARGGEALGYMIGTPLPEHIDLIRRALQREQVNPGKAFEAFIEHYLRQCARGYILKQAKPHTLFNFTPEDCPSDYTPMDLAIQTLSGQVKLLISAKTTLRGDRTDRAQAVDFRKAWHDTIETSPPVVLITGENNEGRLRKLLRRKFDGRFLFDAIYHVCLPILDAMHDEMVLPSYRASGRLLGMVELFKDPYRISRGTD